MTQIVFVGAWLNRKQRAHPPTHTLHTECMACMYVCVCVWCVQCTVSSIIKKDNKFTELSMHSKNGNLRNQNH